MLERALRGEAVEESGKAGRRYKRVREAGEGKRKQADWISYVP